MATELKGTRSVTKFRGGYDEDTVVRPDSRLPGANCITIDYKRWSQMDAIQASRHKYVAISYKHDLRYPDRREGEDFRAMRAPKVVVDEAMKGMAQARVENYWHDGGFPLWRSDLPTMKGSYPYLFEGGEVVIIPPFCSRSAVDVRSWCPSNYPEAAKGMLTMSRYKIVEVNGNRVLKRRRKAGVHQSRVATVRSVLWGLARRNHYDTIKPPALPYIRGRD